jgi:carnitine O-acetyltransferase
VLVSLQASTPAPPASSSGGIADRRVSVWELVARLAAAVEAADRSAAAPPPASEWPGVAAAPAGVVPLFTAAHRDTWAAAAERLFHPSMASRPSHGVNVAADPAKESPPPPDAAAWQRHNLRVLTAIEAAMCVVCLDDSAAGGGSSTGDEVAVSSRNLLDGNGRNRWFDKTVQWVVLPTGSAGFIGEHSHCDGMPTAQVVIWMAKLLRDDAWLAAVQTATLVDSSLAVRFSRGDGNASTRVVVADPSTAADGSTAVAPMHFWQPAACAALAAEAWAQYRQLVDSHDQVQVQWKGYGREWIKMQGFSPDAYAELAIQLAHFRWKGKFVGTYEPAHARKFLWGRTACIRVVSHASCRWVRAMCAAAATSFKSEGVDIVVPTAVEKAVLLREACAAHVDYARRAGAGADIDRHLLGLKLIHREGSAATAAAAGVGSTPEQQHHRAAGAAADFFADPLYGRSSTWAISTSNLSVDQFVNWGWGEVVPGGIGVAFSTLADTLAFNVVGEAATGIHDFAAHLRAALRDMQDMVSEAASGAGVALAPVVGSTGARLAAKL